MKHRVYQSGIAPPRWGVQAVVYEHPDVGWAMCTNGDYYIERDGRWVAVDFAGLLDYIVNELGVVLVGRTISNDEFQAIYQQAKTDRDFARKSGYLPGERRIDDCSSI